MAMRWLMTFVTISLVACLATAQPPGGKSDLDAIQGVWRLVGGETQGKALTKEKMQALAQGAPELYLTFNGEIARSNTSEPPAKFKLDPAKKPKEINLTSTGPQGQTMELKGIYELAGDDLKICFDIDRPTEFKTKEGSNAIVRVLKRVKDK
jgi:uncharacterized protein (TIGR03067 family)